MSAMGNRLTGLAALAAIVLAAAGASGLGRAPAPREAGTPAAECAPLTPQNPDGNYIVPGVLGRIPYKQVGSTALTLDLYAPRDGKLRPIVLVVHGGALRAGSPVSFVGQFLELLTDAGYAWASVEYRLGGPAAWQHAVADVRDALAFLSCHGREAGIDPGRMAVLGEDAGALLAAHVAAAEKGVTGVVLAGGLYALAGEAGKGDATISGASLLSDAGAAVVPHGRTLVVHGTADSEAPYADAKRWCAAVRTSRGACDLVAVEEGIHRAENWRPVQWGYKKRLASWLGEVLGPGTPRAEGSHDTARPDATGTLHKNVVFDQASGLKLDAWIPRGTGPHVPVLLVHGGGWEAGDKVTYITPLFEPLARAGFAWFSIDYRLTPDVRHPEQLEDVRRAIAFVRREAQRYRVDPARLVLVGESASAQMVALVGMKDGGVAGIVPFYGVYDFLAMGSASGPRSIPSRLFGITALDAEARAVLREYSPIAHVQRQQPPMLLVHGTNERLWEQGRAMAARLEQAGAPYELYALDGAPHGMEGWEGRPEWQGYKDKVVSWIREVTRTP